MANTTTKKRTIEELIEAVRRGEGIRITYSSPSIVSVKFDHTVRDPLGTEQENDVSEFFENRDSAQDINAELPEDNAPETDDGEDDAPVDYSDLTLKEFKRLKKEQQKENKEKQKEEKRYNQIRRDVHKRGYDTTVLEQFEDPEEFYELTDEEINQIKASGYINEDGFYDFVFPEDAESLKKAKLSTQKILLIVGLVFFAIGVLVYTIWSVTKTL